MPVIGKFFHGASSFGSRPENGITHPGGGMQESLFFEGTSSDYAPVLSSTLATLNSNTSFLMGFRR